MEPRSDLRRRFYRESHYRKLMPDITDQTVKTGGYLRGLPREELIATTVSSMVVSQLMEEGRLEDALAVSDRLLKHAPDAVALKPTRASIPTLFIQRDVVSRYPQGDGHFPVLAHANELYQENKWPLEAARRTRSLKSTDEARDIPADLLRQAA